MSDQRQAAEEAFSTTIEERPTTAAPLSDAAFVAPAEPEKPKVETVRDTIGKVLDDIEKPAEPAKKVEEAKVTDEKKPEAEDGGKPAPKQRAENGKFAKSEPVEAEEKADKEPPAEPVKSEEKYRAPDKFLPKAKEVWGNVPHPVKGEISRIMQEHESEVSQYRESHEKWQNMTKYEEMAKGANTTPWEALERYTAVDGMLASKDPVTKLEGIRQVLEVAGVTPAQYAEFITQNPQVAQQRPQPQPQAPQPNQEVAAVRAELAAMKQEMVVRSVIDPFRSSHPRYDELQDDIAMFLNSAKVPTSLPPQERLEAAYDMAVRINPASSYQPARSYEEPADAIHVPSSDAGTKSVKGAPQAGIDQTRRSPKSTRDAAANALAELGF
jgi:hypothetical protein